MDIRQHLVNSENGQYFCIEHVDREGFLWCRSLSDITEHVKRIHRLDPLSSHIKMHPYIMTEPEVLSVNESLSIRRINPDLPEKHIWKAAGYKSSIGTYLLIFESIVGMQYINYINPPNIYGIHTKGGYVLNSSDVFMENDFIHGIREFPSAAWIQNIQLYKLKKGSASTLLMQALEKIFNHVPYGNLCKLHLIYPIGHDCLFTSLIPDNPEQPCSVLELSKLPEHLETSKVFPVTIQRADIAAFFEQVYDKPCAYFDKNELEKACAILRMNGHGNLVSDMIKYNGVRSSYYLDKNTYICLRDREGISGYTLNKLTLHPVRSTFGQPMYYEIRMYPLCDKHRYQTVYQSIQRKDCEKVIGHPYANLIRCAGLRMKGYPYAVVKLSDTYQYFTVCYRKIPEASAIRSASYDKKSGNFLDAPTIDVPFLENIVDAFDKIAGIKQMPENRYMIYRCCNNKVVLNEDNLLHICTSDSECREKIISLNTANCYVIHYSGQSISGREMYNSQKMSLDAFMKRLKKTDACPAAPPPC